MQITACERLLSVPEKNPSVAPAPLTFTKNPSRGVCRVSRSPDRMLQMHMLPFVTFSFHSAKPLECTQTHTHFISPRSRPAAEARQQTERRVNIQLSSERKAKNKPMVWVGARVSYFNSNPCQATKHCTGKLFAFPAAHLQAVAM